MPYVNIDVTKPFTVTADEFPQWMADQIADGNVEALRDLWPFEDDEAAYESFVGFHAAVVADADEVRARYGEEAYRQVAADLNGENGLPDTWDEDTHIDWLGRLDADRLAEMFQAMFGEDGEVYDDDEAFTVIGVLTPDQIDAL